MAERNARRDAALLMQRAQEGDSGAFAELYEQYFTPVYRYIFFRVRSKEEAEDLVQTVFLKSLQSLPRFRRKESAPLAFFYTIARNTVIDYWRKKKDVILNDPDDLTIKLEAQSAAAYELPDGHIDHLDSRELQQALAALNKDQQEALVLKYVNDVPNREIARLMNRTETSVRQLQCRALKLLRKHLQTSRDGKNV